MRRTIHPRRAGPPGDYPVRANYLGGDPAGRDYWLVGADVYRIREPSPSGMPPRARRLCSFSSPNRGVR